MLSLKSFHLFFLAAAIVLAGGFGTWGLLNQYPMLGAISLVVAVLLIVYGVYFVAKAQRIHLE